MADAIITNPGNANLPPGARLTDQQEGWYALDPAITVASLVSAVPGTIATNLSTPGAGVGQCVYMQGFNGSTSAAASSPTYPTVALSTTTAQGSLIGVVMGTTVAGNPVGVQGTVNQPSIVQVRHWGLAAVIVDNTTTIGHSLVQSTSVAGALHDSGGVGGTQGETVGFAVQALTVSSGTGYVLAFLKLT